MADNPLGKLSLPAQAGIAFALAAAICGGFYFFWWRDKVVEENKKNDALKVLQTEINQLEVTARKLPEFQREVQLLEASLEKLKLILPTEKQMPDLMKRLQSLTQQSSLNLQDFLPGTGSTSEFYQEVPVTLNVTGTYHNLGLFLDRVGRLVRLVSVGNMTIKTSSKQTPSNTVSATLVARTYVYVEGGPAAGKGPAGAKPPAQGAKGAR